MMNLSSQLLLLQKSVKLTSMLQQLNSFMTCLSDLSWIFKESLETIQNFIYETTDYYSNRKSKRIRLDNIEKEYLTLKFRFEAVDLQEIQMFLRDLDRPPTTRRHSSARGSTVQSRCASSGLGKRDDAEDKTPTESTSRVVQPTHRENELFSQLNQSNQEMRHLNHQISHLKEQNMLFRQKISGLKRHNGILTDTLFCKNENQLNLTGKIKFMIKKLKEAGSPHGYLDKLLYGFVDFEARLKDNMNMVIGGEHFEPVQSLQTARNGLLLQINTMMRELDVLKEQKVQVQTHLQQLADVYQQKRTEGRTLASNNSVACHCSPSDNNEYLLLMQALTIQKLMGTSA